MSFHFSISIKIPPSLIRQIRQITYSNVLVNEFNFCIALFRVPAVDLCLNNNAIRVLLMMTTLLSKFSSPSILLCLQSARLVISSFTLQYSRSCIGFRILFEIRIQNIVCLHHFYFLYSTDFLKVGKRSKINTWGEGYKQPCTADDTNELCFQELEMQTFLKELIVNMEKYIFLSV